MVVPFSLFSDRESGIKKKTVTHPETGRAGNCLEQEKILVRDVHPSEGNMHTRVCTVWKPRKQDKGSVRRVYPGVYNAEWRIHTERSDNRRVPLTSTIWGVLGYVQEKGRRVAETP